MTIRIQSETKIPIVWRDKKVSDRGYLHLSTIEMLPLSIEEQLKLDPNFKQMKQLGFTRVQTIDHVLVMTNLSDFNNVGNSLISYLGFSIEERKENITLLWSKTGINNYLDFPENHWSNSAELRLKLSSKYLPSKRSYWESRPNQAIVSQERTCRFTKYNYKYLGPTNQELNLIQGQYLSKEEITRLKSQDYSCHHISALFNTHSKIPYQKDKMAEDLFLDFLRGKVEDNKHSKVFSQKDRKKIKKFIDKILPSIRDKDRSLIKESQSIDSFVLADKVFINEMKILNGLSLKPEGKTTIPSHFSSIASFRKHWIEHSTKGSISKKHPNSFGIEISDRIASHGAIHLQLGIFDFIVSEFLDSYISNQYNEQKKSRNPHVAKNNKSSYKTEEKEELIAKFFSRLYHC